MEEDGSLDIEEETDGKLKVFISHSNEYEDRQTVSYEVVPKLEERNIKIYGQEQLIAGNYVVPAITKLIHKIDKTLLFISKNSLKSSWCSLELLISLEKSQRINRLAVVLLLYDIEKSEHMHDIRDSCKSDDWVTEVVEGLNETKSIDDIMPAGNVAHGLVWSHYNGYQQYVLPVLEERVKASDWYKKQSAGIQGRMSFKLFEMIPKSCTVKHDLPKEDSNIKEVETVVILVITRAGNERKYNVKIYSVTDGKETFYCMCEFPSVIGTMKVMEDNHLARFSHTYPGEVSEEGGSITAFPFTTDDKELQLDRFFYTMNSVLNHFDNCQNTARVLRFDDESETISEVLMKAVRDDLPHAPEVKKQKIDKQTSSEPIDELQYKYQVYVACSRNAEDQEKAQKIVNYLRANGVDKIMEDDTVRAGFRFSDKLIEASKNCRWLIFLQTKDALQDKTLTFNVMSALVYSICKKRVKVIPVVDRCDILRIPEILRWVTYIPFDEKDYHLKSLHSIVSGKDIPIKTQLILPAGDVAYGLAWNYVTNYLIMVLPDILNGIENLISNGICPHKLYIVIPKSCGAGGVLKDKREDTDRIANFAKTADIFPFGPGRAFSCNIYKVKEKDPSMDTGLYFVGQYAAPVACLEEMKTLKIAGVNSETMGSEAYRFYKIVTELMRNAVPKLSQYCEFIYFDDDTDSLADIMEQKIRS
ncbi:TMEM173 [Mytilus coruscus]|uniref:TMEM173 n=1 Tax=Mytilus coruscus TaxID=42192 RepID=A0A6J8CZT0_MYTCO|nr:TMEM173 [Mytilus coruscus]